MTEKEINDKIYQKLEGELSEAAEQELDNFLATRPEHLRTLQQWQTVARHLDTDKVAPESIELKQEILKRINMDTYKQPPKRTPDVIVRNFLTGSAVRLGLAFALGVFAGLMIFTFIKADFTGSAEDETEMKGTIVNSRSFDSMKTAGVLQFDSPVAKAICNVRYSTQIVEIRLDLSSELPVKTTIEFDFNSFEVLNSQNVSVNDQTTAIAASNFIQINNTGDNKFIFQLRNKNSLPHQLAFKIYQNGFPVYQNAVQVNQE
jgi:hypothetical protein